MTIRTAGLVLITMAVFTGAAHAQKKTAKKAPVRKTAVKTVPPLDVRAAREKVDYQFVQLNHYLNTLVKDDLPAKLEIALRDAGRSGTPQSVVDKLQRAQENFVLTVRNQRDALSKLESEFRIKPALQKYLPTIRGVTDLATRSEDSAVAGRFTETKEPLREAAKKLSDTLALMLQ